MFSLKRTLRLMWLSVRSAYLHRSRQRRRALYSREVSEKHLSTLKRFKSQYPESPVVVVAVATPREVNYIAQELTDLGYMVKKVVGSEVGGSDLFPGNYACPYDFYVGTVSVLCIGWSSRMRNASMFSFSPLGWDRFQQLEGRLTNESTFYANGMYHKIFGTRVS